MKTKILFSLALFSPALYAADPKYSIVPILSDPLEATYISVQDINDSGQIVGYFGVVQGPKRASAFISSEINGSRVMTDLSQTIDSNVSKAYGINNLGQVVGSIRIGQFGEHSFIANKTSDSWSLTDLTPNSFSSRALDINENGEIVGFTTPAESARPRTVFIGIANEGGWNLSNISIEKGWLDDIQIDNTSRVFATARTSGRNHSTQFMAYKQSNDWSVKQIEYLQEEVQIKDHNKNNQVVGYFGFHRIPSNNEAFVATFNNGDLEYTKLGTYEGSPTRAININDAGQIVGVAKIFVGPNLRQYRTEAILFSEGQIYDLKSLVTEGIEGWSELRDTIGINNRGQIIGNGTYNEKEGTPFILTPINQEPIDPPVCELGVDPQEIKKGEGVALWWWSDAVVSGSIDNGIGLISDESGYNWFYPTQTTTYTLTAKGKNGTETTCAATVIVEGLVELDPPYCEVGADPEIIKIGEGSALWWWTENVSSATINNGIGAVTTPSNYTWFYPTATSTYTMNAVSDSGATTSCKVTIEVIK